jgi:hypothetical protein
MICEKYDKMTLLSYVTGDLPGGAMAEVESHLHDCSSCAVYVAGAIKERSAFLDAYPSISGVTIPVRSRIVRFPALRTALALAAGLILAIGTGTILVNHQSDEYRTKGGVALKLFVQNSAGVPAENTAPVCAPGERIQFTYSCGSERYFMLMSVDTTRSVSVFYPDGAGSSMLLEPGNDLPLPNSILLDDYLGKEWYVAVFSARPLQVAAVMEKVRSAIGHNVGGSLTLPDIDHATVRSILLTKRAQP